MSDLYEVIGTSNYANLLADPQGADAIAVNLTPGNGKLKRGQLLKKEATGMYAPAGTSDIATTTAFVVLNEDVDTGASVTPGAAAEVAAAYRAGRFVDGKVLLTSNGTLTAAHKLILRKQNILFDKAESTSGVANGSYTITYVANNGADPAEADVLDGAVPGTTYTVKGNSGTGGTGFTAPASKTFKKWNTKADGSGTDYAAAATISTIAANYKLYAVWGT